MFFKKNKKIECPIDPDMRLWMENAFNWCVYEFGEEHLLSKTPLNPNSDDFDIIYDGSVDSLQRTAAIVAAQMDIDINEIQLDVFRDNVQDLGGDNGFRVITQVDPNSSDGMFSGLYMGKNEAGKYEVLIEERNLKKPVDLVAVLAHEFSHIKLLGEERMDFNNEELTDMLPTLFGLGVFNGLSSFTFNKGYDGWRASQGGYLWEQEFGYGLALYAYFRKDEQPEWLQYLSLNLKSDFDKSMEYILDNTDKIFMEEYKPEDE